MSVKERFEREFENIIEKCSEDVLEGFDFLLSACAELEASNEAQRKRISSLERENNILKIFYSENTVSEESADELEGIVCDLEDALNVFVRINEILANAKTVCSDVADSMGRFVNARNECDACLSGADVSSVSKLSCDDEYKNDTEELVSDTDELEEEINEDDSEIVEEKPDDEVIENSSESDITEQLKNMLLSTSDSDESDSDAPDELSELIMRMLNIDSEEEKKTDRTPTTFEEAIGVDTDKNKTEDALPHVKKTEETPKAKPTENKKKETPPADEPKPQPEVKKDPAPVKKAAPLQKKIEKEPDDFWDENGKSLSGADLYVEERTRVTNTHPSDSEKTDDIKSIKDSLLRIKNKRKGK